MHVKMGEEVINNGNRKGSDVIKGVAGELNDAEFVVKIDDLIQARGISQRQLSDMTGIQLSYLSDFILGKTTTINKTHLLALMSVLRVSNLSDLIEIRIPIKLEEQFELDRAEWIDNKRIPDSVNRLAHLATDIRTGRV